MKKLTTKALMLILVSVCSLYAQFSGGDGSVNNPYQISTPADLDNIRNYPNSSFKLTQDIDLTVYLSEGNPGYNGGAGWKSIGKFDQYQLKECFDGILDGNGKKIKNLKITTGGYNQAKCGFITHNNGTIKNLTIENADIVSNYTTAGIVAAFNTGLIEYCLTSGKIKGQTTVGGIVGDNIKFDNSKAGSIMHCGSTANIISNIYGGGISGTNGSFINRCFFAGNIYGGVKGGISAYSATIEKCYWDKEVSTTLTTSSNYKDVTDGALTTAQMKNKATYVGWDFLTIWDIDPSINNGYPFLNFRVLPPLTGQFNIPAVIGSIESAISILNTSGIGQGGVTFNIAAGHSETFTKSTSGKIRISGSKESPIVFRKIGVGANPIIRSVNGDSGNDAILSLPEGSSYITLSGLDLQGVRNNEDYFLATEHGVEIPNKSNTITVEKCNISGCYNGIYADGNTNISISQNTISNFEEYGLRLRNQTAINVEKNIITGGNGKINGTTGISLIDINSGKISSNEISNIVNYMGLAIGISVWGGSPEVIGNKIKGVTCSGTIANVAAGLEVGSGYPLIANNFISDITAPRATDVEPGSYAPVVNGVFIFSQGNGFVKLYNNTIYLNAQSTTTKDFGPAGVYHKVSFKGFCDLDMRNNIIINTSTPKGFGINSAYFRSDDNFDNYASTSGNNSFYVGTPSDNNVIYYDGYMFDKTIEEYRQRVASESKSISMMPNFVNGMSDMHLTKDNAPFMIGSYIDVVSQDIDGHTRDPKNRYLGADEYEDPSGVEEGNNITEALIISNYPNPFNPTTTVNYLIKNSGNVKLTIYNSKGEFVRTLVNENRLAGQYSVEFDGSNLNSGVYFYKLENGEMSKVNKMLLIK